LTTADEEFLPLALVLEDVDVRLARVLLFRRAELLRDEPEVKLDLPRDRRLRPDAAEVQNEVLRLRVSATAPASARARRYLPGLPSGRLAAAMRVAGAAHSAAAGWKRVERELCVRRPEEGLLKAVRGACEPHRTRY
jgi:hypothetical protein